MEQFSTDLTPAEAPELSTQLDAGRPSETSEHKEVEQEEKKPESRMDAIKRAADDLDKANAPKEEKKEEAVKEDEGDKAEAPKNEAKPKEAEDRPRRQVIEAPEKFLPRAKELWNNVPHEVRSEVMRVIGEAQEGSSKASESLQEYEAIRPYAEMAKRSGTTIDQALGRFVQMEETLRSDPAAGFRSLLSNMQMSPTQAIGAIASAFNVSPERLGQHMLQAPNEYTALAPRPQNQPQQQSNQEVTALQQQLMQMQAQMAARDVEAKIIEPFARENPRYHELEGVIAQFLSSDIIPRSLSPNDRLAAAYDAAVRYSPQPQKVAPSVQKVAEEESDGRAGDDFGGNKSVRGAPATGVDTTNRRKSKMSRSDAINAAMSELGLAH